MAEVVVYFRYNTKQYKENATQSRHNQSEDTEKSQVRLGGNHIQHKHKEDDAQRKISCVRQ